MRRLGDVLMWSGAGVGGAVGIGLMLGVTLPGMPWLFALGLVKLTLIGALGLMTAGAVVRRLARRAEDRMQLAHGHEPTDRGA
jgi:hypothetical protein